MVVLNKFRKQGLAKTIALAFTLILLMNLNVFATGKDKEKVYDYANLLKTDEKVELEEKLDKYSKRRNVNIVVLTSDEVYSSGHRKFNEDFYSREFGENTDLVLLSVNVNTRDVSVLGFHGSQDRMDDRRAGKIRLKISDDLSEARFNKAFNDYADLSFRYLGIRAGINPDSILFSNIFILAISILIGVISITVMLRKVGGRITVDDKTYRDFENTRVIDKRDNYIRTSVTKTKIESNNSSGGGSGGSSSGGGRTSGGTSYSGSSGKF